MKKKINIRRSYKLCHEICTLVPLSKSVSSHHIGLMGQLFYVLDKDGIYMVPLNEVINKSNANRRIRIASKLRIIQIICHGYTVIDSIRFGYEDII